MNMGPAELLVMLVGLVVVFGLLYVVIRLATRPRKPPALPVDDPRQAELDELNRALDAGAIQPEEYGEERRRILGGDA